MQRHLLVAAALREVLPSEPIVVGGTAEEFWTRSEYHETDLDVCAPFRQTSEALQGLGFRKEGRHWYREDVGVAVEIPDSRIDGDPARTELVPVGDGAAKVIGVDDLYIDRLRQATVSFPHHDISFHSALGIAATCHDRIDWRYVAKRVKDARFEEPLVGEAMATMDSRIRREARRRLGGGP